ncbi:F-box/kelch-repeat protein At3g06240-like isoform X1 [Rhododendron vialii]|uniref:F-box/kelch-repeat protein At3g06240-like isoform X1 n=1 Tax=Rhododendron vialii TaxID=182163 RepID=UPI00265FE68D|nr:F-box/kelch-repeat protein At3g06240-like isoform X1 [Rhododendron vialii]XP_058198401.1 F-box/kelch-repeat protein At3g06240-like isoform X1 [Rhododendron vialii]
MLSCTYINFDSKSYGNGDANITYVVVYSLKTDAWRRIQDSHYHPLRCPSGVYFNERLHWLCKRSGGSEGSLVIVAFDLSDEIFWKVQLPTLFSYSKILYHHMAVLGGCLCVIVCLPSFFNEVWMMKEYGVRESWTKFTINTKMLLVDFLCFLAEDEILLKTEGYVREEVNQDKLVVYNLKKKTLRDMVVHGIPLNCEYGCTYVESLVSPNHGGGIGRNE